MTRSTFLILLSAFSCISGLVTEGIKNLTLDKTHLASNLIALIASLIVGGFGTAVYYQLNAIPFSVDNLICMILMGLASGLVSMVGFDKVSQAIRQIGGEN